MDGQGQSKGKGRRSATGQAEEPSGADSLLQRVEDRLRREPDAVGLLFHRACLLEALGRLEAARGALLDVLRRDPAHAGALKRMGALLREGGFRSAARTVYGQAVTLHPEDAEAHVEFGHMLLEANDVEEARSHFERALRLVPRLPEAHQGMAHALQALGAEEAAEAHRALGYAERALTRRPLRGGDAPVTVLMLISARGGNVPVKHLLPDRLFSVWSLVAEFFDPARGLPPHDVVFNAIGDADVCASALDAAERLVRLTDRPVINAPAALRSSGRLANAERLGRLPHVWAPRTALVSRARLLDPQTLSDLRAEGLDFPLLLRVPGAHTGRHLEWVGDAAALPGALAALPGREIFVTRFVETRDAAGLARKYRVMIVDGRLYPLHMAIAPHWKVHYLSADMAQRADHRAEEESFLTDMAGTLGPVTLRAITAIGRSLALDYAGIDFAKGRAGEVVLFEANATMVIAPPPPDPRWDYRRVPFLRIQQAVRDLLCERAGAVAAVDWRPWPAG